MFIDIYTSFLLLRGFGGTNIGFRVPATSEWGGIWIGFQFHSLLFPGRHFIVFVRMFVVMFLVGMVVCTVVSVSTVLVRMFVLVVMVVMRMFFFVVMIMRVFFFVRVGMGMIVPVVPMFVLVVPVVRSALTKREITGAQ